MLVGTWAAAGWAVRFYERHGFTRDGSERAEEVWAGILEVRYRRRL